MEFHSLISGERRGFDAALLRSMLSAVEVPYSLAVGWRNRCFDTGRFRAQPVNVPVASVGNLTLGGTGKTPMVAWLARWLNDRGARVAIVSRGYGGGRGRLNDEALELQQRLPDVPHIQNRDRVAGARQAIVEHRAEVLVLDDAFQHRWIARDLDIVLIDALAPFGYDRVFPRGMLREPPRGLSRAQVVALSRADAVDAATRDEIRRRVRAIVPHVIWLETTHAPLHWRSAQGETVAVPQLAGASVAAFSGIGNPKGFRHTLDMAGVHVADERVFPDHHHFTDQDMHALDGWVCGLGPVDAVVCTQKDLVKLNTSHIADRPLYALTIGLNISHGREAFEQELRERLTGVFDLM